MIRKLLIANRGEIAVRVIRAAQEMGIATVAIYSEPDANSLHVRLADEAVGIGGAEPAESYLDVEKVLTAAKGTGADAVHPGYGFLSERASFADACVQAGLIFVGPPAEAMRRLGAKIEAKQLAVEAGVPVTPGFFEPGASPDQLEEAARKIGYPVMLKASAGGGGRGMRIVREPERFREELAIASDEALKGFGDGAMMVEKLIDQPRHIEVQFLADRHGNVSCLFERECSLQRRHQKVVEEAPSPASSDALWASMRTAVESLVKKAGYEGAGTAEFMFDETTGEFYFLEVNARLQVEHPVTEMVTGVDLVQWQLRIAAGEALSPRLIGLGTDRRNLVGHAVEARIVAEDPERNFMPSIGTIVAWAEPKRPGVRVESGFEPGAEVSRFYDSLIAKVIAHGETRDAAIARLREALFDFHVVGVKTNIAYLLDILADADFRAGRIDTGFLGRRFADWKPNPDLPLELGDLVQMASVVSTVPAGRDGTPTNAAWDMADGFRNAGS